MNGEYDADDWPDSGGTQTSDYQVALEAFRFLSGGTSDTEMDPSLRALQQTLRDLRASYKNDAVEIEYTPVHSLAYLMAYVPLYIEMAERAVKLALQPSTLRDLKMKLQPTSVKHCAGTDDFAILQNPEAPSDVGKGPAKRIR
jgi:hypothetical protein